MFQCLRTFMFFTQSHQENIETNYFLLKLSSSFLDFPIKSMNSFKIRSPTKEFIWLNSSKMLRATINLLLDVAGICTTKVVFEKIFFLQFFTKFNNVFLTIHVEIHLIEHFALKRLLMRSSITYLYLVAEQFDVSGKSVHVAYSWFRL